MGEMTASFWGSNLALLEAVKSLPSSSKAFMQPAAANLLQLQSESLEAELVKFVGEFS